MAIQTPINPELLPLKAIHDVTSLCIRSLGRIHLDHYYLAYVIGTGHNEVLFNLRVLESEEEDVEVKDGRGDTLLLAKGGMLTDCMEVMFRRGLKSKVVAVIGPDSINNVTGLDEHRQLVLRKLSDAQTFIIEAQHSSICGQPLKACEILVDSESMAAVVHFGIDDFNALKKCLVMLTAVKLFYADHGFQNLPTPTGLLSHVIPSPIETGSIFGDCEEIAMRAACGSKDGDLYIDIFQCRKEHNDIFMVAQLSSDSKNSFKLLDSCGICHFSAVLNQPTIMAIDAKSGQPFGTICTYTGAVTLTSEKSLELGNISLPACPRENGVFAEVFYNDSRDCPVARITKRKVCISTGEEKDMHAVSLALGSQLSNNQKAMVTLLALYFTEHIYRFSSSLHLPTLDIYPFREPIAGSGDLKVPLNAQE